MADEPQIASIADYITWATNTATEYLPGTEHFFRGHSRTCYKLEPTIYRTDETGKSFRQHERSMYYEMLRASPNDFHQEGGIFENLVKMQHYGLPTRLLDLTQDALVALYFCCGEAQNEDGRVYKISKNRQEVFFSADIPSEKLFLPKSSFDWGEFTVSVMKTIHAGFGTLKGSKLHRPNIKLEIQRLATDIQRAQRDPCFTLSMQHDITNVIKGYMSVLLEHLPLDSQFYSNSAIDICKKFEIPQQSQPDLEGFTASLQKPIFLLPPINNERIIRQQGAFILFPPHPNALFSNQIQSPTIDNLKTAVISAASKYKILQDLTTLGISHRFLFPENTEQAKHIKSKYQ